jgi:long-chain acyl-CoA synthetase
VSEKTITQHLVQGRSRPENWTAVRFKRHKRWLELTWSDYYRSCEACGLGLAALGVLPGDRVAIVSQTCWEWGALDLGIMAIGAITVPVYQSSRADEIEFIVQNSEPRVVVCEDVSQLKKWESIAKRCKSVEHVICIQPNTDMPNTAMSWEDFLDRGVNEFTNRPDHFADCISRNSLDDLATIVYTSGTTGEPKGVMLTHRQILSEVEDLVKAYPISPQDSTLCFLPFAHVLGRAELWLHTYLGFTLNYAESLEKLRTNLKEVRPTVIIGVPRIFEKIYAGLLTQIEGQHWRKKLFDFLSSSNDSYLPTEYLRSAAADLLIYAKLRQGLGGRLRFVVSGGAALDPNLSRFFHKAGLLILEGYGLTETTAAVSVNTPGAYQFGTVGKPLNDVEVKLADDGEILIKSDKVMTGYYKDPEATARAIKDGYFFTGDVGEFTEQGFLRITDRKKDLIKTAGGKYVAPQKLEGLLKTSALISNVLIHGEKRKYVVALVTLNEAFVKTMARESGWTFRDFKALSQMPELREKVRNAIAQVNSQLASFETIKNFSILPDDFTVEGGELTPSMKVKRKVCDEKFKDLIEELYT